MMEAAETLLAVWAVFDSNRLRPLYAVSEWRDSLRAAAKGQTTAGTTWRKTSRPKLSAS
jgi:hypothetical protein